MSLGAAQVLRLVLCRAMLQRKAGQAVCLAWLLETSWTAVLTWAQEAAKEESVKRGALKDFEGWWRDQRQVHGVHVRHNSARIESIFRTMRRRLTGTSHAMPNATQVRHALAGSSTVGCTATTVASATETPANVRAVEGTEVARYRGVLDATKPEPEDGEPPQVSARARRKRARGEEQDPQTPRMERLSIIPTATGPPAQKGLREVMELAGVAGEKVRLPSSARADGGALLRRVEALGGWVVTSEDVLSMIKKGLAKAGRLKPPTEPVTALTRVGASGHLVLEVKEDSQGRKVLTGKQASVRQEAAVLGWAAEDAVVQALEREARTEALRLLGASLHLQSSTAFLRAAHEWCVGEATGEESWTFIDFYAGIGATLRCLQAFLGDKAVCKASVEVLTSARRVLSRAMGDDAGLLLT